LIISQNLFTPQGRFIFLLQAINKAINSKFKTKNSGVVT